MAAKSKKPTGPRPPAHLSKEGKALWRRLNETFVLENHHLPVLAAALGALDRAEQARKILDAEGLVAADRFGQKKVHPAALVERDNRSLAARLLRELALDVPGNNDARPPRLGGQKF